MQTFLSGGFAVGQVAGWRSDFSFDNKGLSTDEAAMRVAYDIRTKVMPFVANLQTDEQLLTLLTSDEEPYPWVRSQAITRLAEIAMLEFELKKSTSSVLHLADKFTPSLQNQLDSIEVPQYVQKVLAAAKMNAW